MEYNTQQRKLPLPEYGRSVQNMVDHALTIEDRAERGKTADKLKYAFNPYNSSYWNPPK